MVWELGSLCCYEEVDDGWLAWMMGLVGDQKVIVGVDEFGWLIGFWFF